MSWFSKLLRRKVKARLHAELFYSVGRLPTSTTTRDIELPAALATALVGHFGPSPIRYSLPIAEGSAYRLDIRLELLS